METVYSTVLNDLKKGQTAYILGASPGANPEKTKRFFLKYGLKAHQKGVYIKIIFNENVMGDVLYIIKKGSVQIYKVLGSGQEKTLAVLHEQAFFGEMSLLDDSPRSASARAMEDSTLLNVDKDSFKEVVNEYPEIAFEIFKVFSQRLREANKEIQNLSEQAHA